MIMIHDPSPHILHPPVIASFSPLSYITAADEWADDPDKLLPWVVVSNVAAFTVCTTQARFAYRFPGPIHTRLGLLGEKVLELFWNTAALGFMIMGMYASVKYNRLKHKAQLSTLQSWLEVAVVTMYGAHYLLGFWHFFYPGSRIATRRAYYPAHVVVGHFNYFVGNMVTLSWIVMKNYELECWYSMDWMTKDYNPAQFYTRLSLGCRYSNGLGVLIIMTVMFGSYAAMDVSDIIWLGSRERKLCLIFHILCCTSPRHIC